MIKEYPWKDIVWIDLMSPTSEEARSVMEKYLVDPMAIQGLLLPYPKPKVEKYGEFLFAAMHFPAWKHGHKENMQAVSFILGKKIILTAHYENIDALHKFTKMLEVSTILEKKSSPQVQSIGTLFYNITRELYASLEDELDATRDALSSIENKIFEGHEREMVFRLSDISRELLLFKHASVMHRDTLGELGLKANGIFGDSYAPYIDSVKDYHKYITRTIDDYIESLRELRETNNSLLESKQNKIIQTLTVITFVTSAIAIFIATLQIDSHSRPIIGGQNDFWIVVFIAALIAIAMIVVFKWKKWL